MPIITLPRLIAALLSWALLAAAAYLAWGWFEGFPVQTTAGDWIRVRGDPWPAYVAGAVALWSLAGRFLILALLPKAAASPRAERPEGRMIPGPNGASLWVSADGEMSKPTLILTHGWGMNATVWAYVGDALRRRHRVVVWDLPGLGRSTPLKGRYSIDLFAACLATVAEATTTGPVVLVGHSIGGMTTQTFWRNASPALRERVVGMALVDTTHLNPLRTMIASRLLLALQRPLIEPVAWLTVLLWPLAWMSAWQGYLNGSNHLIMRLTGFGKHATRDEVDLASRLSAKGSPAVQAKGDLAMFHWKVTEDLPDITVPTLVLCGDRDIVTLPQASESIGHLLRKSEVRQVEGAGHMGFMEAQEAYRTAIDAFAEAQFAAAATARAAAARVFIPGIAG